MGFLLLLVIRRTRVRAYAGYGWLLDWSEGGVMVMTRLIKSPSGRAGVGIGDIILEYDGYLMCFDSSASFKSWLANRPQHQVGAVTTFRISDGDTDRLVELEAEMIRSRIPYYPPSRPIDPDHRHLFHEGLGRCPQTGQWVFSAGMSDLAYDLLTD